MRDCFRREFAQRYSWVLWYRKAAAPTNWKSDRLGSAFPKGGDAWLSLLDKSFQENLNQDSFKEQKATRRQRNAVRSSRPSLVPQRDREFEHHSRRQQCPH